MVDLFFFLFLIFIDIFFKWKSRACKFFVSYWMINNRILKWFCWISGFDDNECVEVVEFSFLLLGVWWSSCDVTVKGWRLVKRFARAETALQLSLFTIQTSPPPHTLYTIIHHTLEIVDNTRKIGYIWWQIWRCHFSPFPLSSQFRLQGGCHESFFLALDQSIKDRVG